MELQLGRVSDRNPVKLGISVPPDLHQALADYAALYAEAYGEAESVADLIPYMLRSFLDGERAFAKARAQSGR